MNIDQLKTRKRLARYFQLTAKIAIDCPILLPVQAKKLQEEKKSEPSDNYLSGVQNMVLEAKENLLKIDVSDIQEIRTFKDVVLMSKKIEMEKQQFKFKS